MTPLVVPEDPFCRVEKTVHRFGVINEGLRGSSRVSV